MIFFFQFVYIGDYIIPFSHIEPAMIPYNETYSIMAVGVFDVFLDSLWEYFVEYYCIDVQKACGCLSLSAICVAYIAA